MIRFNYNRGFAHFYHKQARGSADMDKEWNEKYSQQDLQRLRGFRLMDDDFKVEKIETQHLIKNLQGRSIILDIYATDHVGKQYNIEIQRADRGGRR